MTIDTLGFTHVHVAPPLGSTDPRTVLLLHGTGGNERDLLDLGAAVAPGLRLIGVRGQVVENGMPRFFRRFAEGVFDEADIIRRSAELAAFVPAAAAAYGFDASQVVALGHSNGANIAASLMVLHPGVLAGGALMRAMFTLAPATPPVLTGTRVLLAEGSLDPIVPRATVDRLASLLTDAGADVTLHWEPTGHGLTSADVAVVTRWFAAAG
ncbi:MAG: alpha/beta hydrolase [Gemmatimonadaceae bacterium]|nr:alpha/beta hydrolase [Gemmatimonadaceae bacterium]